MNAQITVGGGIIGELSEKIPSNIIALNELVKNAYDAGAPSIKITIDSNDKTLTIADNGVGMNEADIKVLFHISKSYKTYGSKNEYNRLTQGSKGLGFLSVFKFGNNVTWITKKDIGLKFSANYQELASKTDISEHNVEIEEYAEASKGTMIIIDLEDYSLESIKAYFQEESNLLKVLYSFEDKAFEIQIDIDGTEYSSVNKSEIKDIYIPRQLYDVRYNSKTQKVDYFHNDNKIMDYDFKFNGTGYDIDVELVIYSLLARGKSNISTYYRNPQGDLTPLIFVNNNLFSNYTLFDPNIMKNIKTSDVLNQMIGSVRIFSDNSELNFNSDRTQFLQNKLTDEISSFLYSLNKFIQTTGAAHKKYLMEFDITTRDKIEWEPTNDIEVLRQYIKKDFSFKDAVKVTKQNDKAEYSFAGKKKVVELIPKVKPDTKPEAKPDVNPEGGNTTETPTPTVETSKSNDNQPSGEKQEQGKQATNIVPAKITLKNQTLSFPLPSDQLDLKNEILTAKNSNGDDIPLLSIVIRVNGDILINGILPSQTTTCSLHVSYEYSDSITGLIVSKLDLIFVEPKSQIKTRSGTNALITIKAHEAYNTSFEPALSKLIEQVNSLTLDKYTEVLACCLRASFELCVDAIRKSSKCSALFDGGPDKTVINVIRYVDSSKSIKSEISSSTKIDHDSLKNLLNPSEYETHYPKLHLGAHKSTLYINSLDIVKLGDLAGMFIVVTNELLNNPKINIEGQSK